jgi:predicted nucleotidyltransferase component of viral defense system
MLPRGEILAWRADHAPWVDEDDVEQDLLLTRVLCDTFADAFLREHLAFRGGTALHKLHLPPAARYSEDLDLVQREPGPIGPTLDRLRTVLGWLGRGRSEIGEHPKLTFAFVTSATGQTRRIKIEINTHEHFGSVVERPFSAQSRPLVATLAIPTYGLDELLATKLRALYQRRKGRDLFDLWYASEKGTIVPREIVRLFGVYVAGAGLAVPRRASFERNLAAKASSGAFAEVPPLLRPGIAWDPVTALEWLQDELLPYLDS